MVIDMKEQKLNTVAQLRAFLEGTEAVQFEAFGEGDSARYAFIEAVVKRLRYQRLKRSDKGVVMRYLERNIRNWMLSTFINLRLNSRSRNGNKPAWAGYSAQMI